MQAGLQSDSAEKTSPTVQSTGFVPPSPEELQHQFPQFEIIELLGAGGMGAVYKARQRHLDRLVAVKILPSEVSRNPAFTERFQREARALAKLNHPHIVGVHDFGQTDSICYFVMEYVAGTNLREIIRRRELRPEQALAIVPQICEALQYAHDEGVVHRDIKPENILVDKHGRVKIADFGLAKLLQEAASGPTLTATHQVMGTLHYMAPEQLQGSHRVDHRADIFSLGVVFYELLTGELPIGKFDPPSRRVQIDVRLDNVVLRSIESEPARRYQRASEVNTDIHAISCPNSGVRDPFGPGADLPSGKVPQSTGRDERIKMPARYLIWLLVPVAFMAAHGRFDSWLPLSNPAFDFVKVAVVSGCLGFLVWYFRAKEQGAQSAVDTPREDAKRGDGTMIWALWAVFTIGMGTKVGFDALDDRRANERATSPDLSVATVDNKTGNAEPNSLPLVAAAARGDVTEVARLLDSGFSVNDKDTSGQTALISAVANGHRSIAATLLLLGADLTAQDIKGTNALMQAVEKRDHVFIQVMKQFWQVSYEQDAAKRRETFAALPGVDRTLLASHDFDLVQFSAWHEATQQVNSRGETPALLAARLGDWEMFQNLTVTVDAILARDNNGRNAVMWFAVNGTIAPFQQLEQDRIGKTGTENGFFGALLAFDIEQLALVDKEGNNALSLARTSNADARVADILTRHLEKLIANESLSINRITRGEMTDEELRRLLQNDFYHSGMEAARKQQLLDKLLEKHTEIRRLAARALGVSVK